MLPPGSIPTMITPFTESGEIDYAAAEELVNWYLGSGCVGIFAPCLSSEMFDLSPAERLAMAKLVKKIAGSRGVVVGTGTYGGSIEEQAAFVVKMGECCDAVVVNTATLVPQEADDAAWQAAAAKLLELTGSVPLGLYECPVPYKRLLSPELIKWCADSGRFHFHKDTCCNMGEIKAKLAAVGAKPPTPGNGSAASDNPFRFYNANVETLLPSVLAGGHGFSGISANFYPHLHAWLISAARESASSDGSGATAAAKKQRSLRDEHMRKVQDFLTLAEATVCVGYPASAKAYLRYAPGGGGLSTKCRTKGPDGKPKGEGASYFLEHQKEALAAMYRMQRDLCTEVGIKAAPLPK
jgi:4-hydroxy-tetrahydrodipicolinate synthase